MLKNVVKGSVENTVWYDLNFDIDDCGGFCFPCDALGKVDEDLNPEARKNYEWAVAHPDKFCREAYVQRHKNTYRNPDHGTCICGAEVDLVDQYKGACQCEKCGRWYNLFGQELIKPEYWEDDEA